MQLLKQNLRKALRSNLANSKKVAVLGIGSDLRADDGAGMLAAEEIRRFLAKNKNHIPAKVFFGGTAPENLTGELKKFKPSHIIMIDCVDFSKRPGSVVVLKPADVGEGVSFSTHKMPARILVDYLRNSFECTVFIVGIQSKLLDFGKPMSQGVLRAAKEVAKTISGALKK